jgi:hypothetical protein
MILIEAYDVDGKTVMHDQSPDGVTLRGVTMAKLNEAPLRPIIDRFRIYVSGGSMWHGRPSLNFFAVPAGGRMLICHCAEDEDGRIL